MTLYVDILYWFLVLCGLSFFLFIVYWSLFK